MYLFMFYLQGPKYCALRNASVQEILGGLRAADFRFDIRVQFHHVFFMGDLNYRLTPNIDITDYTTPTTASSTSKSSANATADSRERTYSDDDASDTENEYVLMLLLPVTTYLHYIIIEHNYYIFSLSMFSYLH